MAVRLVFAPNAGLDISEAYIWYETHRLGLGEEFLTSLDACVERIRRQPLIYPVVHEAYRRADAAVSIRHLFRVCRNDGNGIRCVSHLP
jgi:hypothetical protein